MMVLFASASFEDSGRQIGKATGARGLHRVAESSPARKKTNQKPSASALGSVSLASPLGKISPSDDPTTSFIFLGRLPIHHWALTPLNSLQRPPRRYLVPSSS
ncbi:unnamed protein product [Tenebrio molitor]|nr:unnamed protein product [Tenebrio molitor]